MSSMESFYGGRQGASFVIVKRFDGLDIPDKSQYRLGWYAKDEDDYFYVPLIAATASNYASYPGWGTIPKDGVTTVTSQSGLVSDPLPAEYAEGMKQCFEKGGASASEVGYGEYVIIDTIAGIGEYNNPDNGKVYRRGMNYDDDLGGAEYIGQIVGPRGSSPKLSMGTMAEVLMQPENQERHYTMQEGDSQDGIVPGKYENAAGTAQYNDDIDYGWATIRDNNGNITGALIGFTFPFLVPEISSVVRSPYYTQDDYDKGRITDASLIGTPFLNNDNFDLFVDNGWDTTDRNPNHGDTGHPYYRKWKVSVPQGIKGDTQTQLEIVPTKMRLGAELYGSSDLSGSPVATADDTTYVILDDDKFTEDCVYPYDNASAVVACQKQTVPGITYYARIEDTYMLKFRYRQTWYDDHADGSDYNMIDLGDYNTIRKVWLTDDGWLWVRYNADEDSKINPLIPIQWFDDVNLDQIGSVIFTYNTLDSLGNHTKKEFNKALSWVQSITIANKNNAVIDPIGDAQQSGHVRIMYNNDTNTNQTGTWTDPSGIVHGLWETDITWPQSVSLTDDGLLKFLYNNNLYVDPSIYTDPAEGSYSYQIPWITRAAIDQNGDFRLYYNNDVNKARTIAAGGIWNDATNSYYKKLHFIDHVTIDNDGMIHFWYSDNTEAPNAGYLNIRIKYINDVDLDTGLDDTSIYDFDGEGTGDQKIHVTYNTETVPGIKDEEAIGAPLNYIMEAIVTKYDKNALSTPQNHLLVLYSDPAYRAWLASKYPSKIMRYTSQKFTEADPTSPGDSRYVTRNDWFDLGYVKGEPGGLHIIGQFVLDATHPDYHSYLTDGVPPEDPTMTNDPEMRGWAYLIVDDDPTNPTRKIYTYDYPNNKWILVSDISSSVVDPVNTIIMDNATIDGTGNYVPVNYTSEPNDNGLWLVEEMVKAVY